MQILKFINYMSVYADLILFPLINVPTDKHGDPVFQNYQELNAIAFSGSVQKEGHTKGTQSVACKELPIHTKSYQVLKSFKTIQRSPLTMFLKLQVTAWAIKIPLPSWVLVSIF